MLRIGCCLSGNISGQSSGTPIFSVDLGKIVDFDGGGSDGERGSVTVFGVGEDNITMPGLELIM
jgi:hypothetical protein